MENRKDNIPVEEQIRTNIAILDIIWKYYLEDKSGQKLIDPKEKEAVYNVAKFAVVIDASNMTEAEKYYDAHGWQPPFGEYEGLGLDRVGQRGLRAKSSSLHNYVRGAQQIPWKKCREEIEAKGLKKKNIWSSGVTNTDGLDTLGKLGGTDPRRFEGDKGKFGDHPADEV